MRAAAGVIAGGAGLFAGLSYMVIALSDPRFVMPMIESPLTYLGIPGLLGALVGAGALSLINRPKG